MRAAQAGFLASASAQPATMEHSAPLPLPADPGRAAKASEGTGHRTKTSQSDDWLVRQDLALFLVFGRVASLGRFAESIVTPLPRSHAPALHLPVL